MARKRSKPKARKSSSNVVEQLWQLVQENPQVALAIAMAVGALVSEATRSRGNVKKLLARQLTKGAELIPEMVAELNPKVPEAMKILAGPALQAVLAAYGTPASERKAARAVRKTRR